MRILQINTFPYKATGNIMLNLHDVLLKNNIDSYVKLLRKKLDLCEGQTMIHTIRGVGYKLEAPQ